MNQAEEITALLHRMSVIYGQPETPDPRAFIREYESLLKKYSGEIIRAAGDYIRDNHTRRSWPTPGEIRAALLAVAPPPEAIDWDAAEAKRKEGWKFSDLGNGAPGPEAKARVQAMVDEFKRNLAANRVDEEMDSYEPDWKRGQRDGFLEMQRNSPNKRMHMRRA